MKQRGFTLIELMVVIAIGMIIVSIIAGAYGAMSGNNNISMGINGMTESRCIEGYKFVIGEQGRPHQILDEFGKGVRCSMVK
jgi:prepilin-type N-terminal cleavage/methylation domain-containing protein